MPLGVAIYGYFLHTLGVIYMGNAGIDLMVLGIIALWGICYLLDEIARYWSKD